MSTLFRRLPALAVAASMAWTAGCGIDTEVQGVTADADIAMPELMPVLAHGANMELSHVYLLGYYHATATGTDEMTNGYSNSGTYRRRSANQYYNRPDLVYSQTNEGAWVAAYAAERMQDVNVAFGTDPDTDPLIAHMWMNAALAIRALAEMHCIACVGWGPAGGNLLREDGSIYDPSVPVDADSIMRMAITWADMAAAQAQRAVSAGRTNEVEPTWEHFVPENALAAANGVRATGYMWLEDYAMADQMAAQVPIDHVWNLYSNQGNSWRNRWYYMSHVWVEATVYASAIGTTFKDVVDTRIPWVHCGEFIDEDQWIVAYGPGGYPLTGGRSKRDSDFVNLTSNDGCQLYRTGSRAFYNSDDDDVPNWAQTKYTSYDDELPLVTGTEMKLIRAEIALRNNDLAAFEGFINEVREYHDMDPLAVSDPGIFPLQAGALEYPNAQDDAWSILDRETLFTQWLDGRRWANFHRWDHPYWTAPHYSTADELADNNNGLRPNLCLPLPQSEECNRNPAMYNSEWCQPILPPGG